MQFVATRAVEWNVVMNTLAEELVSQTRSSRFRGVTGDAGLVGRGRNPLCGDEIQLVSVDSGIPAYVIPDELLPGMMPTILPYNELP